MILPKVVTFTGADDSVKAKDLLKVSNRYPDVEWGILFGAGTLGAKRFPSYKWITEELPHLEGLNLTAHLCGRFVYDLVLRGDFTWLYNYPPEITRLFQRIQLNFHGQPFPSAAPTFHMRILHEPSYQFICQNDGVNKHLYEISGVVTLFDLSHGAGVLPEVEGQDNPWPKRTICEYMGYAGGLGPDNIKVQLKLIEEAAMPNLYGPYWIDCETKVRSHDGKLFDLKKVKAMCKEVWD